MEIIPQLKPYANLVLITDPPYGVEFKGKFDWSWGEKKKKRGYLSPDDPRIGPELVSLCLPRIERGLVFPSPRWLTHYPEPYDIGAVLCPIGPGALGRWGWISYHPVFYYGMATKEARNTPSSFASKGHRTGKKAKEEKNTHPCPKPIEWMRWAVSKSTVSGDIVLDGFLGSGTTGVACIELGRRFIGIEKEKEYFDIAVRRMETACRRKASRLIKLPEFNKLVPVKFFNKTQTRPK